MRDRFVAEYRKDLNATRAAVRAGYSPKTAASQGQRLLKSPVVGKAIAEAQTRLLMTAEVSVEWLLKELAAIAFLDPGELVDEHGLLLPIGKVPPEVRRAASTLEVKELFRYQRGKRTYIGRRWKLRISGKLAALKLLAKYLNMFGPNRKHTIPSFTPSKPPTLKPPGRAPSRLGQKGRGSFRRNLFALEYLKDLNATKAAIRAGYSPKTAASQGQRCCNPPPLRG